MVNEDIEIIARHFLNLDYKVTMEMDKIESFGLHYDFLEELSEELSYKAFELLGVPMTKYRLLYEKLTTYHQRNYHKNIVFYVDGAIKIIQRNIREKAK
jgi:Zn-dependent M16 (insulinase) family peptidase